MSVHCKVIDLVTLNQNKSFVKVKDCCISSLLIDQKTTNAEKLYYLLVLLHSTVQQKAFDKTGTVLSADDWAAKLQCSPNRIYKMQKSLELLGKWTITRDKDDAGLHQRNVITIADDHSKDDWSVSFNIKQVELLLQDKLLTMAQKVFWLYCYQQSYNRYYKAKDGCSWGFTTTIKELMAVLKISKNTVKESLQTLSSNGYLLLQDVKVLQCGSRRRTKQVYKLSALLPQNSIDLLLSLPERQPAKTFNNPLKKLRGQNCEDERSKIRGCETKKKGMKDQKCVELNSNDLIIKSINKKLKAGSPGQSAEPASSQNKATSSFNINILQAEYDRRLHLSFACLSDINLAKQQVEMCFSAEELEALAAHKQKPNSATIQGDKNLSNPICHVGVKKIDYGNVGLFNAPLSDSVNKFIYKKLSKANIIKIKNYATCLKNRGLAKTYASAISTEQLAQEMLYHAAHWQPTKNTSLSADLKIKIALQVAWDKVSNGTWTCPYGYRDIEILEREHEALRFKYQEGYLPANLGEHVKRIQKHLV